ncbi:hypothetical protein J3458_020303 [Metarhizium acridum]|uniref:uncharacterized protein n=1 Tax=Metarhizium acridum TaxID=92637 RepID=UPI001C6B01C4|nr:hypothetical protein J3458_020303 [Metarhizium acridum]
MASNGLKWSESTIHTSPVAVPVPVRRFPLLPEKRDHVCMEEVVATGGRLEDWEERGLKNRVHQLGIQKSPFSDLVLHLPLPYERHLGLTSRHLKSEKGK